MTDRQETIADIIAEMKREAAQIFPALPIAVLQLANRIEAAHDHDIAIATEASARAVVGACVKQQEAERKCVALREAMVEILEYIESFHKYIIPGKRKKLTTLFAVADTIRDKARAALDAPPRTADECRPDFIFIDDAPATTEKPSAVGNGAKLREALKLCLRGMCGYCRMDAEARGMTTECVNGCQAMLDAKAALAAPPRNCDRFATLPDALAAWRDVDPREAGPFDLWLFDTAKEGGAK